ncbi:putative protein kinase [Gigaspora margarita]|uniref:Uncharacterized protein n=1 Tax=Gigaspora margarita TaxID=4874 RepID=A0A8H4ES57_GIGMA|nr:putative protein kinase [Gigaspora margarita]
MREELITCLINDIYTNAQGDDWNEIYGELIYSLENSTILSEEEKNFAIKGSTWDKNFFNMNKKGPKYICSKCEKSGYTIDDCEHCLRDCLSKDFGNWTSGSSKIDGAIREAQIQMPLPRALTEWIPYTHLENIKFFKQGGCSSIYTATWTNGLITSFNKKKQMFERTPNISVALKYLKGSATANDRFLNELKAHVMLASKERLKGSPEIIDELNTLVFKDFVITDQLGDLNNITLDEQLGAFYESYYSENFKNIKNHTLISQTYKTISNLSSNLKNILEYNKSEHQPNYESNEYSLLISFDQQET